MGDEAPEQPGTSARPVDSEEEAARRVRALLAQHVPLALVVDLTSTSPSAPETLVEPRRAGRPQTRARPSRGA